MKNELIYGQKPDMESANYVELTLKNDEYYTPAYAVRPILKYLKPNAKIWCPLIRQTVSL